MIDDKEQSFKEYKKQNYNKELNEKLIKLIKNIPDSNGSRYFEKIDKNIAIITDEFMYDYYKDCTNIIYINYFKYKEIIEKNKIDIFLYVTTWHGLLNSDWRGGNINGALKLDTICEIVDYFKSKNIPTIFQSKEDPSNYDRFISIAKKCDYIFTTDKNKIENYKKDCNNENVYLCSFGINPLINNPIGIKSNKKLKEVLFAGSWMSRYSHRCKDMKTIFDGVLDFGKKLDIIDRNFNKVDFKTFFFPREYIPYTCPPFRHDELQKIQKLYDWIINLNSIKYSPTMCAVRSYESQACGNCILSNYSMAVNYSSPNIFIVNDKSEVKYILNQFNEEELYRHQMYGVRNVMNDRCVFDKISYMLQIVNPNLKIESNPKKVLVIVDKITPKTTEIFNKQLFEEKYLIEKSKAREIYEDYDFVAFFKDNYIYGEYYLQDMINGFKYTDSDYITKDSYYEDEEIINGIEHNYINVMKDKYKSIFDTNVFTFDFLNSLQSNNHLENGYSIDHFELKVEKSSIKKNLYKSIFNNKDKLEKYKISIIIDVYNDGKYLLNKCFNSLKRSNMFEHMEIILIDNNSDDKDTQVILRRLNNEYKNIKLYSRNINISLVKGEYITFFNPSNEIINDGYSNLCEEISDFNYDMIIGNMLKLSDKEELIIYNEKTVIEEILTNIMKNKLDINIMQGILIRKKFILDNKIETIPKNIKESNLLFYKLMQNVKKIKVIDDIVCIYYNNK